MTRRASRVALGASVLQLVRIALTGEATALGVTVPAASDDVASRIGLLLLDVNRAA